MGAAQTKNLDSQPSDKFKAAMKRAANVGQVPVCSNFWMYKEHLRPILDQIIGDEITRSSIKVSKSEMYHTALSYYKGKVGDTRKRDSIRHETLMITFDDTDIFDYDGGGYRREFYSHFFMKSIADKSLFTGPYPRLLPNYDERRLEDLTAVGIGIVEAILNLDCGFPYLNPALFHFLAGDDDFEQHLRAEDIPNPTVKMLVEQIMDCKSDEELVNVITSEEGAVVQYIGWSPEKAFTLSTRHSLVHMLTKWSIIGERRPAIDAFRKGLNYMKFLDKFKDALLLEPLFVNSEEFSVNKKYLKKILQPALEKLESKTEEQRNAKKFALQSIDDINDDEARSLYHFITGLHSPSVNQEDLQAEFFLPNDKQKLPQARTCFETLLIPLGNTDYAEFRESFAHAIQEFGQPVL